MSGRIALILILRLSVSVFNRVTFRIATVSGLVGTYNDRGICRQLFLEKSNKNIERLRHLWYNIINYGKR